MGAGIYQALLGEPVVGRQAPNLGGVDDPWVLNADTGHPDRIVVGRRGKKREYQPAGGLVLEKGMDLHHP
jgi:hypothetical protein